MITIDGYEIYSKWTLKPTLDGFYNSLMKQPDIKDRIVGDYSTKSGIEVMAENSKVKSTIRFFSSLLIFFVFKVIKYLKVIPGTR